MSFNNAPILHGLESALESSAPACNLNLKVPTLKRRRVVSEPCLPERLPNSSFMQREAEDLAPRELSKQLRGSPSPSTENPAIPPAAPKLKNFESDRTTSGPPQSPSSIKLFVKSWMSPSQSKAPASWSDVQPFEVMRAVEERNIMFLMEIRDRAFHLLLRSSGGETPLVHAIRIGHKDVAIVLLGAFSRWVNHLEDSDIAKSETQSQLKALRVGLKLAINEGLASSQRDLIASFMQTLIMSEGDKWVWAQVSAVSRALNVGPGGKPVQLAGAAVRRFATRELGKADLIASLEDYIANATADLVVMGAWTAVLQSIRGDNIPSYYFARDDRVYKALLDRLETHKLAITRSCTRRLRLQLNILRDGLQGRNVTFRQKVELLALQLDEGNIA